MVEIQFATTEIRRGKKDRRKIDKNIMPASATQGGHKGRNKKKPPGKNIMACPIT